MAGRSHQSAKAGVRGALLVVVAAGSVLAATHLPDLGAAITRAIGDGIAQWNQSVDGTATASPAAGGAAPATAGVDAPAAAQGRCVTFPAAGAPSGRSVFIDPGHGGPDPGVVGEVDGAAVMEKTLTLAVAKRVTGLLQNAGYRVIMSRTGDSAVAANLPSNADLSADDIRSDLLARIACANRSGADLLVSIHFNGVDDASVSGSETYYDAMRPFAASNHRLALDLERSITAAIGSVNLGVWPDDQNVGPALSPEGSVYGHLIVLGPPSPGYVDAPSQMPGALVEPLFLSNGIDAKEAADPRTQQLMALAIDAAITAYFSGA